MKAADESGSAIVGRIEAMLDEVKGKHGVRVLLAIESGSRAWGFPSRDSDWDVRFLYLRPLAAYLTVQPSPDVIEMPLTDDLDVKGWDLRKALALLVGSNAVVMEWLSSPVVYRRDENACVTLARLARDAAYLPALEYHYDRLARRHWTPHSLEPIRLKTLFYALRPALALAWMRAHHRPPPMDLPALMAALELSANLVDAIEQLRAIKLPTTEGDIVQIPAVVDAFLFETLAQSAPRTGSWDKTDVLANADKYFAAMVMEELPQVGSSLAFTPEPPDEVPRDEAGSRPYREE